MERYGSIAGVKSGPRVIQKHWNLPFAGEFSGEYFRICFSRRDENPSISAPAIEIYVAPYSLLDPAPMRPAAQNRSFPSLFLLYLLPLSPAHMYSKQCRHADGRVVQKKRRKKSSKDQKSMSLCAHSLDRPDRTDVAGN